MNTKFAKHLLSITPEWHSKTDAPLGVIPTIPSGTGFEVTKPVFQTTFRTREHVRNPLFPV